jgi:cytosine/adenosine deaminase-related metal-dependent hydrolase
MKTIVRAAWVAPMDGPVIRDGAVAFAEGTILSVGSSQEVLASHPDASITELGNSVILPGLINPHTHLELSGCVSGESAEVPFVEWILSIRQRNQQPDATAAARLGIAQCLRFGVTCVGDITQRAAETREALAESPLRAVSFGEVLGLSGFRSRFEALLPGAIDQRFASEKLRIGLTPHAPYTVDLENYRRCVKLAREQSLPLATHLAETIDEREFLNSTTGPFRWAWEQLGTWKGEVPTFAGGPIEFARDVGLLDDPTVLAHVNYCDDPELAILARGRASVVYCPRTHAYFGHPPHRWREMLTRGINVAIGTDSCASSPDLNLVDELRLLRKIAPEVSAQVLWELVTVRAANALSLDREIGSLAPGKFADLAVFDVAGNDPLTEVLDEGRLPKSVWINGRIVSGRPAVSS